MKTIQSIIEDETYKTLKNVSDMDKVTLSVWVRMAIESELKRRKSNRRNKK